MPALTLNQEFLASSSFAPARPTFTKALPGDETMRFANFLSNGRPALFTLQGTAATDILSYQGAQMSFMMEPSWGLIEPFKALESTLELNPHLYSALGMRADQVQEYTHRPTLTGDHLLRIKLNTNSEGGWKFTTDDPHFTPDRAVIRPGTAIQITVGAGLYFCESDNRYGLYLTLKHLDMSGDWMSPNRGQVRILKRDGIKA